MIATAIRIAHVTLVVTAALATAVVALLGIGVATGVIHTYDGPMNAGAAIRIDGCTGLGFEYRGDPGLFTDLCQ